MIQRKSCSATLSADRFERVLAQLPTELRSGAATLDLRGQNALGVVVDNVVIPAADRIAYVSFAITSAPTLGRAASAEPLVS